jgi:transcriptional regulator with XRE-family HTH domain
MDTKTAKIKRILKRMIHKSSRLNQKTVAARVGITTSYLSQLLDDKRGGSLDLLERIAAVVGTSIGELEQMAAGWNPNPAETRITHIEVIGMFTDHDRALRLSRKLVQAERMGLIDAIEDFVDYQISKKDLVGRVVPTRNAK